MLLSVTIRFEREQLRWPMRAVVARFVQLADLALREEAFAEIALVHRLLQDDFINAL